MAAPTGLNASHDFPFERKGGHRRGLEEEDEEEDQLGGWGRALEMGDFDTMGEEFEEGAEEQTPDTTESSGSHSSSSSSTSSRDGGHEENNEVAVEEGSGETAYPALSHTDLLRLMRTSGFVRRQMSVTALLLLLMILFLAKDEAMMVH